VSLDYAGNNAYPVTVTIMEDGDETDAASYAVGLEQLADRTAYLNALITGGIALDFTDATFHGATIVADGTIAATVDSVSVVATGTVTVASGLDALFLGGNSIELGSTTHIMLSAADVTINATDDLVLNIDGDALIDVAGNLAITGADAIDLLGGRVLLDATHIELATNVSLGGGVGDTVTVQGTLAAVNNATFAVGKTVSLSGVTTAADLRATVSNIAGITYSGAGRAHYRQRLVVVADFSLGHFIFDPFVADAFYIEALTGSNKTGALPNSGTYGGDIIEISTLGMTGGFTLEVYDEPLTTLLLSMTATANSWSRWIKKGGTGWRLLAVSDG
jgi:hypothetical protein